MPAESAPGLTAAALVAVAVCCGLPVLLSAAGGVVVAGVGLGSWLVVLVGLGVAGSLIAFGVRARRRAAGLDGPS